MKIQKVFSSDYDSMKMGGRYAWDNRIRNSKESIKQG